jgi:hypothetical protein
MRSLFLLHQKHHNLRSSNLSLLFFKVISVRTGAISSLSSKCHTKFLEDFLLDFCRYYSVELELDDSPRQYWLWEAKKARNLIMMKTKIRI